MYQRSEEQLELLKLLLSTLLGVVCLSSSIPKFRHPRSFTVVVLTYDVLPVSIARMYR